MIRAYVLFISEMGRRSVGALFFQTLIFKVQIYFSFLELDVLHIKVTNFVRWIGGGQADSAAVRLDTTELHVI